MSHKKALFMNLVLYSLISNSVIGDQNCPSVIIIGAGASGIAAASKLLENGFTNITILEAEDRIGGRLYTTQFGGYLVDVGGQWVQGEVGNIAYDLAFPLGLLEKGYFESHRTEELYDSSGTLIDQTMTEDLFKLYQEIILENSTDNMNVYNISIGEFITNDLNKYLETHSNWNESVKGVLNMFEMREMSDIAGNTWFDVSMSESYEYHEIPGEQYMNWKERTYGFILEILMKRYPNPEEELPVVNKTILNAEVSLIDNTDKDGKVAVTTTKGDTYLADHVIVTTSLGVLKEQYSTLFKPPLSSEKVKTIKGLDYGCIAKIYLSFEKPWWTNESTSNAGFQFLWKDDDISQLENDPEKSWLLGLTGFNFVEHKPNILCGWLSGKHVLDMEKLSEQQVFNHSVEALQRFVGKYYNVTTPTGMLRSMWNSNKHFRGTYSFRSMKSDADNVWHATLAEPIGEKKPVILFAGEATNPHSFATVHGALASGLREANRLVQLYTDGTKNSS